MGIARKNAHEMISVLDDARKEIREESKKSKKTR